MTNKYGSSEKLFGRGGGIEPTTTPLELVSALKKNISFLASKLHVMKFYRLTYRKPYIHIASGRKMAIVGHLTNMSG